MCRIIYSNISGLISCILSVIKCIFCAGLGICFRVSAVFFCFVFSCRTFRRCSVLHPPELQPNRLEAFQDLLHKQLSFLNQQPRRSCTAACSHSAPTSAQTELLLLRLKVLPFAATVPLLCLISYSFCCLFNIKHYNCFGQKLQENYSSFC